MNAYWITFAEGSAACCEGENAYDARRIAEKLTGKSIEGPKWEAGPNVVSLPYPASPVVWQLDHPVSGKCPTFCYAPNTCKGRTSCPQRIGCTE